MQQFLRPVKESERNEWLDSLRGLAVLGILLVNIAAFGLPYRAVFDPSVINDLKGPDFYSWLITEGLLSGTMRSIFSMLFGVGMLLFIDRIEKKNKPAGGLFYRRQSWLLLFGLVNAYFFLWFWDILFMYAICGMLLFGLRHFSSGKIVIGAILCMLMADAFDNLDLYRSKLVIQKGEVAHSFERDHIVLTGAKKDDRNNYISFINKISPEAKRAEAVENIRLVRGSLREQYGLYSKQAIAMQTTNLFSFFIWDILLFMLLGIVFYRSGIITGEAPVWIYWMLFIFGIGLGLLLSWIRLKPGISNNFDEYLTIKNTSFRFYEIARCCRALGVFGLIMLLYKSGKFGWLFKLLRPVGRMALTNYLLQSILCGLFFYGTGFGMFGRLERIELYYVVAGVWLLEILFSYIWLRYFLLGPFEWIWKSLTYSKRQPLKRLK